MAGGLNLYGFANGDPVNFSDPFGLCAQSDSLTVTVCVLDNGREREVTTKAAVVSDPALMNAITQAIGGMTFAGASANAELGAQAIAALGTSVNVYGAVAVFPNTVDGMPVVTAAGTVWHDGADPALALRADVAGLIQGGGVNRLVPVPAGRRSNLRVCGALGHEGVHMALGPGSGEGTPTRLQGGFRCR